MFHEPSLTPPTLSCVPSPGIGVLLGVSAGGAMQGQAHYPGRYNTPSLVSRVSAESMTPGNGNREGSVDIEEAKTNQTSFE